jgi:hypothetical protein
MADQPSAHCECGMPHLGGTEHADECPVGIVEANPILRPRRDYREPPSPFLLRGADALYDACARAVRAGRIDARSPIGDAVLDYRELRWPDGDPEDPYVA